MPISRPRKRPNASIQFKHTRNGTLVEVNFDHVRLTSIDSALSQQPRPALVHQFHPSDSDSLFDVQGRTVEGEDILEKKATGHDEDIFIDFEPGDPANPFNWSRSKKWTITLCVSWFSFLTAVAPASFPLGISGMRRDLHVSQELALLGLSCFPLGFATAPLVLAPFSEAYGRNPVYIAAAFIFTIFTVLIGKAPNLVAVCFGRFISGCAASTGSTMVGGTLADMWLTHERGLPMSIFSAGAFTGTGIGPAFAGYVAQKFGWRWIQYIQAIAGAITCILFVTVLRETRGSIILSRIAAKLRKETGDSRYKCKADEERASLKILITVSLSRPLWFLFTEPVVFFFSLWASFAWGVMYVLLEAIPLVMAIYGANEGQTGLAFLSLTVGGMIGVLSNPIQEAFYRKNVARKGPEARLYGAVVGGMFLPIGCMIFAWTAGRVHWIVPLIGVSILLVGIYSIFCATFNYLADTYTIYASSALAAQSFARNMMAAIFPLYTTQMYKRLGYDWASFTFGMIALVLAIIPFVALIKGPQIRTKSKVVMAMQNKT